MEKREVITAKAALEEALGVPIVEKKEYKNNGLVGRNHRTWEETYFTDESESVRIKEGTAFVNNEWVKGFVITRVAPADLNKLKDIYKAMKA